ncbi:MAG: hypothetical protein L0H93_12610, partial [Nocardioides sp.]|nr:hypothetical protein [Nocardioides sp.]
DFEPQLSLNWLGKRKIDRVSITVDPNAPARRPTAVTLIWPGGERDVELDERGRARFRSIRTDQLRVRITGGSDAVSIDPAGIGSPLPVGISEIRFDGLPLAPRALSKRERALPCGSGPTVTVNQEARRTQIIASAADLYAMKPTEVTWCDGSDIDLPAGESAVTADRSDFAIPERLDLLGSSFSHEVLPARTTDEGPVSRTIQPSVGSTYLALQHNANPGWVATQGDEQLEPVTIDGWRQGWRTDGSTDPVSARFAPDRPYQWGLGVGLLLLVVLAGCALLSPRRWPGEALPALQARRIPDTLLLLTGVALGGLFGGWLGLLAAVGGMALGGATLRWLRDGGEWLVASLVFVGALGYFIRPWGSSSGWAGAWAWPHYLVLVALSAALVVAAEPRPRFLSRMKGSSIKR